MKLITIRFDGDACTTRNRKGAILALAALLMIPVLAFAAFSIDIGYIALAKSELQTAADAAAMAGAQYLSDGPSEVWTAAELFASKNKVAEQSMAIVSSSDVEIGNWDEETATFVPLAGADQNDGNAVRVTCRLSQSRGNQLSLFFAPVMGIDYAEPAATAIALREPGGDCFNRGVVAGDRVTMGQDIRLDNYCVYGRNGVDFGQDPQVINGSKVGALDKSTIEYGQDPVGLPESIVELDKRPELAEKVMTIIDDLEAGINWPPQITKVVQMGSQSHLPSVVESGTAYIFDESISIDQDYAVQDVIIATRKNISWGQDGQIRNTGDPSTGGHAIGILAGENIALGQDAVVLGANLIAGKDINIGQDVVGFDASVEAAMKVTIGQDPHFISDYESSLEGSGGSGSGSVKLVQ